MAQVVGYSGDMGLTVEMFVSGNAQKFETASSLHRVGITGNFG